MNLKSISIILSIFTFVSLSSGCSSRKGFSQNSELRKKHQAIQKRRKSENKKRFQFLTRDQIKYERYKPSVPF